MTRRWPIVLFAVYVAALGLFAYFASTHDTLPGEASFSAWVQSWRAGWLDGAMKAASTLGILAVALPATVLAGVVLWALGMRSGAVMVVATTAVGRVVALAVKVLVARPRPTDELVAVIETAGGFAFPSGHAMHYSALLGALAVVLVARLGRGAALYSALALLGVALAAIGLSRVYLGAHLLLDVVAGYAFGAALVAAAAWLWRRWSRRTVRPRPQR